MTILTTKDDKYLSSGQNYQKQSEGVRFR